MSDFWGLEKGKVVTRFFLKCGMFLLKCARVSELKYGNQGIVIRVTGPVADVDDSMSFAEMHGLRYGSNGFVVELQVLVKTL